MTNAAVTMSSPSTRLAEPLSRRHIPALDGLRGVAILLVLGFHFAAAFPLVPESFAERLVDGLLQSGWCGVDLFFVLSGFLITGILYDTKSTSRYFRNYYARRVLRIFPLYYALLIACFVVIPRLSLLSTADCSRISADQPWYWLFCSNLKIAMDGSPSFGFVSGLAALTWSLAIEEQFYLMWPLLVFACRRTTLLRICAVMVVGALALRVGLILADVPRASIYVLTPCRFDGLALGAAISLVLRGQIDPERIRSIARKVLVVSGVALGGIFTWYGSLHAGLAITQSLGLTLLAFLFGALLTLAVLSSPENRIVRIANMRGLRIFGKYSYAIYLLHQLVFAGIERAIPPSDLSRWLGSGLPAYFGCLIVVSALSLLAAMASWYLFERHFLRLKRFFEYSPKSPPVGGQRQPGHAPRRRSRLLQAAPKGR
ncbi:MAG: acyltransferase [Thermoguttaceae bacterium]